MANFDAESLKDLTRYKTQVKRALGTIKEDEVPFLYSEKHQFTTPAKKAPLFIIERSRVDPKFLKAVKDAAGTPLAEGTCYYTEDKAALVLEVSKGKVAEANFDVDGIHKIVVRSRGDGDDAPAGPIPADKNLGGNKIDLAASKLAQFRDVLARQQAKLDKAVARIAEVNREQEELKKKIAALTAKKPATGAPSDVVDAFKAAVAAANDAKLKFSSELNAQTQVKKLAESVIGKAAAATTDQEKADAVFADDKFGAALNQLEGTAYKAMMATNDAVMVLGRTTDTWKLQLTDEEQARTLAVDPSLYTLSANDAFMKGGLDIKARFQLVTDFAPQTVAFMKNKAITSKQFMDYLNQVKDAEPALWDSRTNAPAVSAREVGQLLDDGYWFGVYTGKDGKTVQMMFPRALKPETLAEIDKLRKG